MVRSTDIREVVNDEEWQQLRVRFLGTWKSSSKRNVFLLREYLGSKPWSNPWKIRRVLNYLTGTGFRVGSISSSEIEQLREEVRERWKEMLDFTP